MQSFCTPFPPSFDFMIQDFGTEVEIPRKGAHVQRHCHQPCQHPR